MLGCSVGRIRIGVPAGRRLRLPFAGFFFPFWVGEEGGWEMRMAVEGGGGCSRDEIYVEDFGEV